MKVFSMNDCDWWIAETIEDAKRDYLAEVSGLPEDVLEDPCEVSDADMDRLMFVTEPKLGIKSERHSFREELSRRVESGEGSQLFASTEY